MKNRIVSILVAFSLILPIFSLNVSGAGLNVSAKSAILMNADTGEIIYEKDAYTKRGMASTTKIMTSVLALESGDSEKEVTVRQEDVRVEGTSVGLKAGDIISIHDLVYGMLLSSGNDCANVCASALCDTKDDFVQLMNKKAKILGMTDTNFTNPSGLPDENHYSTAYDMALLGIYAIKNPAFVTVCSSKSATISFGNPKHSHTIQNHNKLLTSVDGVFGLKTGFTKSSGRCLVSCCYRNGITLVCVTLSAPNDWQDHETLYDYGFKEVKSKELSVDLEDIKISVVGSEQKFVNVEAKENITVSYYNKNIQFDTVILCEKFLYAGVKKGDKVGKIQIIDQNNKLYKEIYLYSKDDAPLNFKIKNTKSIFERIKQIFYK
ncbi:MAG: D-alanyl-D-alanine carboxypeptidase family protein [Acutalibacteraceae bacterium]